MKNFFGQIETDRKFLEEGGRKKMTLGSPREKEPSEPKENIYSRTLRKTGIGRKTDIHRENNKGTGDAVVKGLLAEGEGGVRRSGVGGEMGGWERGGGGAWEGKEGGWEGLGKGMRGFGGQNAGKKGGEGGEGRKGGNMRKKKRRVRGGGGWSERIGRGGGSERGEEGVGSSGRE